MGIERIAIEGVELGLLPDVITRLGIRALLRERLRSLSTSDPEADAERKEGFIQSLRSGQIALLTEKANEQHYELPPEFFRIVLGSRKKYSSGYWDSSEVDLNRSEERMLSLTTERAQIQDEMSILDLGCGWGSFSLWAAEHFPNSPVCGVSNSAPQRAAILAEAERRGFKNLEIVTADINTFAPQRRFDRIVTIEMFEHMHNYEELFRRVSSWLESSGKIFIHIFTHREYPYPFEEEGDDNWMGRYFFSGGLMPSADLPLYFQEELQIEHRWMVNGSHYARTCEAWLKNQDQNRDAVMKVLRECYGEKEASRWFHRWRMFFLACAELFAYRNGEEWFVSHYLFSKRGVRC